MSALFLKGFGQELTADERELLSELIGALRRIRFGSIVLTVHDGRLVEIQRTEKIRRTVSRNLSKEP